MSDPERAARGRVCLFTGISGTLGQDFAARYADEYVVVGVYRSNPPPGPSVKLSASKRRPPGAVVALQADLAAPEAVADVVDRVLDRFGSVDLLVNAAVLRHYGELRERAFTDSLIWQYYLNACVPLELAGALARKAWRHTPQENLERRRNVVNLSSTAGHRLYPGRGQSGYGSSKAALDLATRHLAVELAELGVRANAVAPDTFPQLVPTTSVSDAVVRYDRGERTGDVLVIDADGERLLVDGSAG